MLSILEKLPDLLFPLYCYGCQNNIISKKLIFCDLCFAMVKKVVSLNIPLTKKRSLAVFSGGAYEEPLKTIVKKKFSRDIYASKLLGKLIIQNTQFREMKIDIITTIPLHWSRYAWRGYNQAKIIASELSQEKNIPIKQLLIRKRQSQFQSKLSAKQRERNVEDIFCINPVYKNTIKNKNVALVDDLYTTGATMKSAAKALVVLNPLTITAFVGCRAIR